MPTIATGIPEAIEFITHGVTRFRISGTENILELIPLDTAGGRAPVRMFSRFATNGKQQLCVQFSSGAIQILATEP